MLDSCKCYGTKKQQSRVKEGGVMIQGTRLRSCWYLQFHPCSTASFPEQSPDANTKDQECQYAHADTQKLQTHKRSDTGSSYSSWSLLLQSWLPQPVVLCLCVFMKERRGGGWARMVVGPAFEVEGWPLQSQFSSGFSAGVQGFFLPLSVVHHITFSVKLIYSWQWSYS